MKERGSALSSLEFRDISKIFPGVRALDRISFQANGGEVVAMLGENGAGKSTLLKILNGDYKADGGQYLLDGEEKHFRSPLEAIEAGISIIYQERQFVPYLSVAENIFMEDIPVNRLGFIDFRELNRKAQEIIDVFQIPIRAETQIRDLSVAHQQMVEIMKAYSRNADIICFDEPTAPLTDAEIPILFRIIRKLKKMNKVIIYVSHRMNELFQIADRVIVFKDGKFVADKKMTETDEPELIRLMVGRDLGDVFQSLKRNKKQGEVVLEMNRVTTDRIKEVSLQVHAGEILGLSGLAGAGRTETARAVFGADPMVSGEMFLDGQAYRPKSPRDAMDHGIALCPEDRKLEGLALIRSVKENIDVSILNRLTRAGFVDEKKEAEFIRQSIEDFSIKTPSPEQKTLYLSGGNQQKIILARWLAIRPKLVIFDEPTKGIDVGAKAEIYQMICDTADSGAAVILISSELPEVIGLSDRILVMKEGRVRGEILQKDATEALVLSYAMMSEMEKEETNAEK